ncbi:hypothetical protein AVEN_61770-1 [Araneus ventricosus]|uniref:Uncharacterized protein n=1 Tax=Araneus ventricosus TaxID=182803 RepID=A0A4Y2LL25_ARAVE|nr:hypothetical protein AVEN_61770-1 [Araneus ventricosus]
MTLQIVTSQLTSNECHPEKGKTRPLRVLTREMATETNKARSQSAASELYLLANDSFPAGSVRNRTSLISLLVQHSMGSQSFEGWKVTAGCDALRNA